MRDNNKVFQGLGCAFAIVSVSLAIYIAAYLCTVSKTVYRGGAQQIPGGSREIFINGADLGGNITRPLFSPALKIDRRYIRKRYWADWYEVVDGGKTNVVFPDDFSPEEVRKRLKL